MRMLVLPDGRTRVWKTVGKLGHAQDAKEAHLSNELKWKGSIDQTRLS